MSLVVITNQSSGQLHLGNPDRDNPAESYDAPKKINGCLDSAMMLRTRTLADAENTIFGSLVDGSGARLAPIEILETTRVATKEIGLVHPSEHYRGLLQAAERARAQKKAGQEPFDYKFGKEAAVSPGTPRAAMTAVGGCLDVVDIMLQGRNTAFALVWPPGHHAEPDLAMGFCYLSNAAIAAKYCRDHSIQVRPGSKNRVVVIDIDHHRGNGTAKALVNEPEIMLVDMVYKAPYDEEKRCYTDWDVDPVVGRTNSGKEYPYTRTDDSIGAVAHPVTKGKNILSTEFGFSTPDQIMERFLSEVLPKIHDFQPDVILWSLGLDSAQGDILGGLGHIPGSFYTLLRGMRLAFPNARHGGVLEGGYDPANWYRCLQPCLLALHEDPTDSINRTSFFGRYRERFLAT